MKLAIAGAGGRMGRALIDALSESDLDLTGTRSESDLKAILTARLGRYRG